MGQYHIHLKDKYIIKNSKEMQSIHIIRWCTNMIQYKLKAVIKILGNIVAYRLSNGVYAIDMTPNEIKQQLIKNAIEIDKIILSKNNELFSNLDNIETIQYNSINYNNGEYALFNTDSKLESLVSQEIQGKEKRRQFNSIIDYIEGKHRNHIVYALYGLRRTGKTTLLLQACQYCIDKGYKVAYGEISKNNNINFKTIYAAISELISLDYKVIIIMK